MKIRRLLIAVVIAVIILPAAVLAFFISEFDPNRYGPNLTAAVEKATGRQLLIGGQIKISLSLNPEISVDNVSLANPPGFADPDLLTIQRLQARIALLPLLFHQLNIVKLIVLGPAVILETTNTGAADWDLTPPSAAAMQATEASGNAPGKHLSDYKIALEAVEIRDGSIIIRPAHSSNPVAIALASVTGTATSTSSPLNLHARASFNGVPIDLHGVVGPVARFSGAGSGPWPVDLTLSSSGATATVDGSLSDPRKFSGYDLFVKFAIPALETIADAMLGGLIPKAELPPIHGILGTAELVDQNAVMPAINHLTIKAAASDLSSFRPGLTLTALDIEAPSLTRPISVNATGAIGTAPLSLAARFGPASVFINPGWLPPVSYASPPNFPVSIKVRAGNDNLDIDGGIATPMALSGAALTVNLSIPDLSSLSPLAGTALPGWKNIAAQGSLTDPDGLGLMNAIGVDSLVVTMDNSALGGDLSWYFGNQPRMQAALRAQQINLDSVFAQLPNTHASPAVAPAPPQSDSLVPQFKLPVTLLKNASADIQVAADRLVYNQAIYTAIQGHAVLAHGVLTINPVTAVLPGGGVTANATVDATKDPASVTLAIDAPALALSPFLKALRLPSAAEGTVQARLSVAGTGNSSRDLSSSMNGQLGMAMVQGTVDGAVLSRLFGIALSAVDLPASLVGAQGPVAVRCFGLRVDAQNGIGQISALTLDSNRLLVQGGGSLDFGNETLGIILRPQIRLAGNAIGVPVKIGGTFANPTASVAPLAAVQEAAKTAAGLTMSLAEDIPGGSSLLGKIETTLGTGSTGDVCPAALSLARLGKPGPAAPPQTSPTSAGGDGGTPSGGPKNLLDLLFNK